MLNVEFKCELLDPALARALLPRLGAGFVTTVRQHDRYFRVASGRLKRRHTSDIEADAAAEAPPEYIFYERPDALHPTLSRFEIYSEEGARRRYGVEPLPVWLDLTKRRELWMAGPVRIQLDDVEGLGWFLELEALVTRQLRVNKAREAVTALRRNLAPALGEPMAAGYADLLSRSGDTRPARALPG